MGVSPLSVRSLFLTVGKRMRWIPLRDLGSPVHRKAVKLDAIVDAGTNPHFDWQRGQKLEVEKCRRDQLQILRLGKEVEHPFDRLRKPHLRCERLI